jgi:hypothetical protein
MLAVLAAMHNVSVSAHLELLALQRRHALRPLGVGTPFPVPVQVLLIEGPLGSLAACVHNIYHHLTQTDASLTSPPHTACRGEALCLMW